MNEYPDAGPPEDPEDWYTPPTDPPNDASRFPWPPAAGESVVAAYARTWQESALRPRSFFAALPPSISLGSTLLYYMPIGIAVAGAALFWSTLSGAVLSQDSVLGAGGAAAMDPLIEFLLTPVLLLLSLFVSAAFTHVLLKLFGGASRGYGHTVRIFAFAYSPQILGVIPFIGQAIGLVWMVWVAVVGVREGHRTSTGRAAAAVLIPLVIVMFLLLVLLIIARASGLLEGLARAA